MENRKVYDDSGEWWINTGAFNFADPESGVIFSPGVPTKVTKTAWLETQPVMCPWSDKEGVKPSPAAEAAAQAEAKLAEEAAAKAAKAAADAAAASKPAADK